MADQSVSIQPELVGEGSSSVQAVSNNGIKRKEIDPASNDHGWDKSVGNVHRNPNWFGDMEEFFMASVKRQRCVEIFLF